MKYQPPVQHQYPLSSIPIHVIDRASESPLLFLNWSDVTDHIQVYVSNPLNLPFSPAKDDLLLRQLEIRTHPRALSMVVRRNERVWQSSVQGVSGTVILVFTYRSPCATCQRLFASSAVLTEVSVIRNRCWNGFMMLLVNFVSWSPTVTMMIAPGPCSRHEVMHSSQSLFSGSTDGEGK